MNQKQLNIIMKRYVIYNSKNEKTLLKGRSVGESGSKTMEISWTDGIGYAHAVHHVDGLERFLKHTLVHKGNVSRKYKAEEISEWIIVLWNEKQLELDFTDTFTVKEFLLSI